MKYQVYHEKEHTGRSLQYHIQYLFSIHASKRDIST